jgi:hypothetical protein
MATESKGVTEKPVESCQLAQLQRAKNGGLQLGEKAALQAISRCRNSLQPATSAFKFFFKLLICI